MMILAIAALPFSGFSQKNNNKKDIAMTTINKLEFHNLPTLTMHLSHLLTR